MKNRKRILKFTIIVGLALSLCLGSIGGASGSWATIDVLQNDINVVVNNRQIYADNFLYNDTTYLPMRAIGEALGINVSYDGESNTAYVGANNYYGYAEEPWCPDMGAYLGLDLPKVSRQTVLTVVGTAYDYYVSDESVMKSLARSEALQQYLDMLYNLGFRPENVGFLPTPFADTSPEMRLCNGDYTIVISFYYDSLFIRVHTIVPASN